MLVIPAGKKMIIHRQGETFNITNVPMILDEPVTLDLNSNFESLVNANITKNIGVLSKFLTQLTGGAVEEFSGQLKQFGLQVWAGTDPVSFNVTVTFRVDKTNVDALNQVYRPALKLMQIPLPSGGGGGGAMGGNVLIGPGPSLLTAIEGEEGDSFQDKGVVSVRIGRILYIPKALVKKAQPTFSIETDEQGYPMWAKVNLDILSAFIATKETIDHDNILSSETTGGVGGT